MHAHSVPVVPAAERGETRDAPHVDPAPTPTSSQLRRSEQARRFRAVPRTGHLRAASTPASEGSLHTTSRATQPTGHPSVNKIPPVFDNPETNAKARPDPDVVEQLRRWEAMHAAALRSSSPASSASHGASPAPTPPSSALPAPFKQTPVLHNVARATPKSVTPSARRERSQVAAVHGTAPRTARRKEERGEAATLGAHGRRNDAWSTPRREVDADVAPGESWYRPAPKKASAQEVKGGKTKGAQAMAREGEKERRGLVAAIKGWF